MRPKLKKIKETVLDKAFSLFIRKRDKRCVRCGQKDGNLQCAHIFSRTARSVRWLPLNAITLCYKCHMFWAHKNPIEFAEFIKGYLGAKNYAYLRVEATKIKRWTDAEKRELLSSFR